MSGQADIESAPWQTSTGLRRRRRQLRSSGNEMALLYGAGISPVWDAAPGAQTMPEAATGARRDTILRRSLACADVAAAYLAVVFVITVVANSRPVQLRLADLLIAPFVLLVSKAIGLYDRDQHVLRRTTLDEAPSVLYLSVLVALALWLGEALLFDGWLGRPQVFALVVVSFGFIFVSRVVARALVRKFTPQERCLVLGEPADATRISQKLDASATANATVVGRVSLHADRGHESPYSMASGWLTDPGSLARIIAEHGVQRVIIAPDSHDQEEVLGLIRLMKVLGMKVSVLPRLFEVVGSSSTFEDIDGLTVLGVRPYGVSKSSGFLKRSMDIGGAAIGLFVLAPLLLLLALAVKVDSRGPVFFRQRRIGCRGEVFSMIKFRSMVRDADTFKGNLRERNEAEGGLFKMKNDPRVTRVGRFLRTTSLDELPQLLNVLGGSMSLVGPRPLVQDEDRLIEGWQRRRLAVKPGMTGMWQIYGSSRIPMQEMVKIDYLYGTNWSIWLDLKILMRTVPYVLRRRGI